jgi:hypothetical protein
MRHLHHVSKPQVAVGNLNLSTVLQTLLVLIEVAGQLTGFAEAIQAKKGDQA